jgi:hypothetical protein
VCEEGGNDVNEWGKWRREDQLIKNKINFKNGLSRNSTFKYIFF